MNLQRVRLWLLADVVITAFLVVATKSGCINLSASACGLSAQEDQELASWTDKTKLKILKGLGLSAPPVISILRRNVYKKESVRIRRQLKIQGNEATTELQTYPAWAGPPEDKRPGTKNRLFFAVKGCKDGFECIVHQAVLQIYFRLKPQLRPLKRPISITIANDRLSRTTTTMMITNSSWIDFNVMSLVQRWITNPKNNKGLTVVCSGCKKYVKIALWFWNWKSRKLSFPNPVLKLRISKRKLKKSTARFCHPNETHCCRRRFHLDFHKIGWDWIIAPKKLYVHGCHGDCRPAQLKSAHSRLLRKLNNITSKGLYCCRPTRYSPYLFTYFSDSGKVVTKSIDDISVDECGCP